MALHRMDAAGLRPRVAGAGLLLALCVAFALSTGFGPRITFAQTSEESAPPPSVAGHPLLIELSRGLGSEPAALLRMKFEVTFMKIDVADLEARIAGPDAATVEPLVRNAEKPKDAYGPIAEVLLQSRPILLTMSYLRDSDFGRFQKGIRSAMEAARKDGVIDESEETRLLASMEATMAPIETREVFKDDVLAYRIDGDMVRTAYVGADGEVVADETQVDPALARALVASWFGDHSRFREKLLRSLFR